MRIGLQRGVGAIVGQGKGERQGGVGQGLGRGAGHGAGHIGHAVVDDAVDHVGRVGVGGGLRGLEATALIDGHVDDH